MTGLQSALRAAALMTILGSCATAFGGIIASDGFGDGDRNNDGTPEGAVENASDTGLAWYTARGTSSIAFSVPNDNGSPGIGSGNAMNVNISTTSNRPSVAAFNGVTLADGDKIALSLAFRAVTSPVPNGDRRFRIGLYDSMGTAVPGDTSTTGFTNDDVGYMVQFDTGVADGNVLSIFGNTAGTLLGGTSQALGATSTNAQYAIIDNNPHTLVLTLERSGPDLLASVQLDSLTPVSGATNASGGVSPLTFKFDQIALGMNGLGMEFRIDNVSVDYTPFPEPSSLAVLALGAGALYRRGARVTRCDC